MDSLDFFRRNLKPLMAALTLMAMITFVFGDSMNRDNTALVPIVLAMLLAGGAFVWGTRKNKSNEYAAMGAVIGLVLGMVIITFGKQTVSQGPKIAGLSSVEIGRLKQRREAANKILTELYVASHPMPKDLADRGAFMVQFYNMQMSQQVERLLFGFGREIDKDVVFTHLLEREAKQLGITVNDDAVSDFLKMICDQKLTTETFQAVRKRLRIGEEYLFDVLREEIAARLAASVTVPHISTTPEQRWRDFRKVSVRNTIEATTIPVEPFVKGIEAPSDDKLTAFFSQHAEKFPGEKGEPGFRQPQRIRLAYVEADFEKVEEKVTPPTDDEVAKYYEDNKNFYIDRTPAPSDKKETELDPEKKDTADSDKPADGEKPDQKPDAEKTDGDKKSEVKKPEDKPTEEKPAEPAKDEKKKEDVKTDDKPTEKKPDLDEGKCDDQDSTDKEKSDKPSEPAKDDKKVEDKPEVKKPDVAANKDAASKTSKSDSTDAPQPDTEKPAVEPKEGEPEKKPEVKYKSFESVKEDIREQLLRTRTLEEMTIRIDEAVAEMRLQGSYLIDDVKDPTYRSPEAIAASVKEFAEAKGLKYYETSFVSAEELRASTEYKIATATDPIDPSNFNRQGPTSIVDHVFARNNDNTHSPEVAEDLGTKNRFAYWVVERKAAHVAKFKDPGIREQVLKSWKLAEARPKAESRAKELAKLATDKKPLTEVMADQTTTGDKDGLQLTVVEPPEFAHFTQQGSSAPQVGSLNLDSQPVELTQIVGLDKVGDDTLSAIDAMTVGSTAVVPNLDGSAFFVIHLKGRVDVSADDDAPQRKDFIEKWPFSVPASQLANNTSVPLRREWYESIERKYGVVWPVK